MVECDMAATSVDLFLFVVYIVMISRAPQTGAKLTVMTPRLLTHVFKTQLDYILMLCQPVCQQ